MCRTLGTTFSVPALFLILGAAASEGRGPIFSEERGANIGGLFMGNLLDSSELKCAAGLGLTALGIGFGVPIAAKACTESLEKIVERAEAPIEEGLSKFKDQICEAPLMKPGWSSFFLGALSPITTLTVPFSQVACQSNAAKPEEILDPKLLLEMALPFAGPGPLLAYGVHRMIEAQMEKQMPWKEMAGATLQSLATFGAAKALHQVQYRSFIRVHAKLPDSMSLKAKQK